jgi:hypothetical protein
MEMRSRGGAFNPEGKVLLGRGGLPQPGGSPVAGQGPKQAGDPLKIGQQPQQAQNAQAPGPQAQTAPAVKPENAEAGAAAVQAAGNQSASTRSRRPEDQIDQIAAAGAAAHQTMGAQAQQAQTMAPGVAPAHAGNIPQAVLNQIVEHAVFHQNRDGHKEFRLGLNHDVLGGARLRLRSYGDKRFGITLMPGDSDSLTQGDLQKLISTLNGRGMEVVDATIDQG